MGRKHIGLLSEAGDKKQNNLITVTGTLSEVFHSAIDKVLSNDATDEDRDSIGKIVALESAAQDTQILEGLANKFKGMFDYRLLDKLPEEISNGETVIDVYNADNVDSTQIVNGMDMIERIENGVISAEQYNPVFICKSRDAVYRPGVLSAFDSICKSAGVAVCIIPTGK